MGDRLGELVGLPEIDTDALHMVSRLMSQSMLLVPLFCPPASLLQHSFAFWVETMLQNIIVLF